MGDQFIVNELDELNRAVASGDSYAQAFIGLAYVHGDKGLQISMQKAFDFAKESASKDHWLGEFVMGFLARFPPYGPDPEKVKYHYLKSFQDPDGSMVKAAAEGDPIAAYALAEIFTSDEVRPTLVPDLQIASEYYEISASAGYQPASVQFALMKLHAVIDSGMGIKRDLKKGIELLENATLFKLPAAHHYLGRSYFEGIGVEPDKELALVHFRAAADRGFAISQLTVADFYAHGVSGPPKMDLALRYAKLALIQEEEKALAKIAEYEEMKNPSNSPLENQTLSMVPTPEQNIVPPAPPTLDQINLPPGPRINNKENSNRLPSVYLSRTSKNEKEVGVKKTGDSNPYDQFQVDNLNFDATKLRNLAKGNYWGREMPVNFEKAYSLFLRSSEEGDAESARYLGMMFMQGKGVTKNPQKALYWFGLAAERGDSLANSNLARLRTALGK